MRQSQNISSKILKSMINGNLKCLCQNFRAKELIGLLNIVTPIYTAFHYVIYFGNINLYLHLKSNNKALGTLLHV